MLQANGGDGGGSGGGGRIAVWRTYHAYEGAAYVTNGQNIGFGIGAPGTIFWGYIPIPGTIYLFQ